jgi:WD40 repeat protein
MYATFDRHSPVDLGTEVLSLSWKGDSRQGWLAAGNSRKTVGVTYTELKDWEGEDSCETDSTAAPEVSLERQGMRRNFNFREHSAEVTIVQWNKHLDKIATCDASGTVIVWRNHNGRSVMELVNNRGTPISDFKWSNDGNKVLIAYTDGYILVGTAYGRRIWARNLNLGSFVTSPTNHSQNSKLLSSTWSPDDSRIVIGSSIGELIELNATHGGMLVSTTEVLPGIGIIGLEWVEVPKSVSSGSTSGETTVAQGETVAEGREGPEGGLAGGQDHLEANSDANNARNSSNVRLSLYLRNGKVVLMNSCGDQQATIIRTGLMDGRMAWAAKGSILAVAGFRKSQSVSTVRFFQPTGQLMFTLSLGTKVRSDITVSRTGNAS